MKRVKLILVWLTSVGIGTAVSYPLYSLMGATSEEQTAVTASITCFDWIIIYIVVIQLTILIHELGHYIFGRLSGFKLVLFVVGPFRIQISGKQRRVKFDGVSKLFRGAVSMTPSYEDNLRVRYIRFVGGGPMFSLLSGICFIVLYRTTSLPPVISAATPIAVILSLFYFFYNILPIRKFGTDGAKIQEMIKNTRHATILLSILRISAHMYNYTRPSEIDSALYEIPLESEHENLIYSLYQYGRDMDLGLFDKASDYVPLLEKLTDNLPRSGAKVYLNELCFIYGWILKDNEKFASAFEQVKRRLDDNHVNNYRVLATHYLLKDEKGEAIEEIKFGIETLSQEKSVDAFLEVPILHHFLRELETDNQTEA